MELNHLGGSGSGIVLYFYLLSYNRLKGGADVDGGIPLEIIKVTLFLFFEYPAAPSDLLGKKEMEGSSLLFLHRLEKLFVYCFV